MKIEAEIPVDTGTTPVDPPAPTPSIADTIKGLNPVDKQTWQMTGKFPEPKTPDGAARTAAEPEKELPTPAEKSKSEPDSGPGFEEQERERDEKRKRGRVHAAQRAEIAALKRQLAGKPAETPAAPAPAKPADGPIEEPDIDNFDGTPGKTYKDFQRAERAYLKQELAAEQKAAREADEKSIKDAEFEEETAETTATYNERAAVVKAANPKFGEHSQWIGSKIDMLEKSHGDQIVDALLEAGPEAVVYFGEHRKEFTEILGMPPARGLRAIGRAEASLTKPPVLKPVTRSNAPAPGDRVNSNSSAAGDPIQEAYAQHAKTGDKKHLALVNRLKNEADLARFQKR